MVHSRQRRAGASLPLCNLLYLTILLNLPADHTDQEQDGDGHHDDLGDGLGPDHAPEAEGAVEQEQEGHIEEELTHQGDAEGILGLAHGLEGHAAHGDRAHEGQDPHDGAQNPAAGRDDDRGIREDPDQQGRGCSVDCHDTELGGAGHEDAGLENIQHPPVVPGPVIVAHDGLGAGGEALVDVVAQGQDLLRDPHGGDRQLPVADRQLVVDDVGRGGQKGLQ